VRFFTAPEVKIKVLLGKDIVLFPEITIHLPREQTAYFLAWTSYNNVVYKITQLESLLPEIEAIDNPEDFSDFNSSAENSNTLNSFGMPNPDVVQFEKEEYNKGKRNRDYVFSKMIEKLSVLSCSSTKRDEINGLLEKITNRELLVEPE